MDMNKKKKGFTLIELIVVIAILGILAAIAIPRLSGFTDQAKKASDEQMANVVANAAATYYAANNSTVPTMAQLATDNLISKNYTAADLTSSYYKAGSPVFTIEAGTSPIILKITIGGTHTYVVNK